MTASGSAGMAVYRPFPGEVSAAPIGTSAALDDVWIVRLDGRMVGACRLARPEAERLEVVASGGHTACSRAGIGRWLLGHTVGVAVDVVAEAPLWLGDVVTGGLRNHVVGFRGDRR